MSDLSILRAASDVPDRPCLVWRDGELTYAQVAERVRAKIAWLFEQGARSTEPSQCIALTPRLSIDSVVSIYALIELGVPMALLHPRWPQRTRNAVLDRIRPSLVLEASEAAGGHEALSGQLKRTCLAVMHTSGTAGAPKSVVLSRRAFTASARASEARLGWQEHDRWLMCMSPAHVGGLSILIRMLLARRTVVLSPDERFDPRAISALVRHTRATVVSLVPTMLKRLVDDGERLPSLRAALVGGGPLSLCLRERAVQQGVPLLSTYGCTEACSQITTQEPAQSGSEGAGTPLRGIEVRLREGVIEVSGPVLADGYFEDGQVVPLTKDGWFRTGDLGEFRADGQLQVLGRTDEVIISGGENVSPVAVESFLESIPGIESACVFGVPDEEWGHTVAAALVCSATFDLEVLRTSIERSLSPYERPKRLCTVRTLPVTALGKIDRATAAEALADALRPI